MTQFKLRKSGQNLNFGLFMSAKYVLVVDDEQDIRDVLTLLVESLGYIALTAENGEEAINLVKTYAGQISLVISDIRMPKMNGAQLVEYLKGFPPTILMSGFSDVNVHKIINNGHAKCFIKKPFRPDELLNLVQKFANTSTTC